MAKFILCNYSNFVERVNHTNTVVVLGVDYIAPVCRGTTTMVVLVLFWLDI